jgi:homopolymeric O-antigen transport system permease protein
MRAYCRAIWSCRYFWLSLVRLDLRSRYRGSVLGMGWSLLQPIAMTAIVCVVFCGVFKQSINEMAPFIMVGMAVWNFIMGAMLQGCQSFFAGESYIRQFPAPMAIYPLRTVLATGFHLALALVVSLFLAMWSAWNVPIVALAAVPLASVALFFWRPGLGTRAHVAVAFGLIAVFLLATGRREGLIALLTLPVSLLMLIVVGWSVAMLSGVATVFFRDTRHLSEVVFQIIFYLTPIIYPEKILVNRGLGWLVDWNPVVPFLQLIRQPIGAAIAAVSKGEGTLPPSVPDLEVFVRAAIVTLLLTSTALYTLTRVEKKLIFHL